ncbi:MAG: hypothetical protein ABI700_28865, partial [Chloroflexota bacterium]
MLRQPRPLVPFTFPLAGQSYAGRILNTRKPNLIALWGLGETTGSNAANAEGTAARDGTYTNGPTLNAAAFTDGTPAPSFDGSNDLVNVYSSSLNSAFNPSELTLFIWGKVASSGVWSDATFRYLTHLQADASNRVYLLKSTTGNAIQGRYLAGGVSKSIVDASLGGTTAFFSAAITVSKAADEMKLYLNGVQVGSTQTGLGTWTGA